MDEFEIPTAEQIAAATDEQLAGMADDLTARAGELAGLATEDLTDEQIDAMEAIADALDAVDAESEARAASAEERSERAAQLRSRLARPEVEAEAEAEVDAEAEVEAEAAPEAEVAVAAAARRPAPRRVRVPAPTTEAEKQPMQSIVAAADVGGTFAAGSELTSREAAEAFVLRSRAFPDRPAGRIRQAHNVFSIRRDFGGMDTDNRDFASLDALLSEVANPKRLTEGVTASGGWCAPSETDYAFGSAATRDGIVDLPEFGVTRGGVNYTVGPDYGDIYTSAGFHQTEAEAIAGTQKACAEITCPPFTEVRLDAVGLCVKAPLLTMAAYPELVEHWLTETVTANDHKVAGVLVSAMQTALGAAIAPTLTGTPVAWSVLSMLELMIEGQRQRFRLSESEMLEVKAPRWLRAAIRADLANRIGAGIASVTNQQIQQHFADRGGSVQWILGYQELTTPTTRTAFPSTAEVMVYRAGTFVKGVKPVVSLDTVYDSTDLRSNVYTAAFVEDGVLLMRRHHGGARVTLPVHITGQTGAADLNQAFGLAQVLGDI